MRFTCYISLKTYAAFLAAFVFVNTANAQDYFENYTAANGFPNTNVAAIIQDSKGFIWLGSSEGLSKFDGRHFTVFSHSDTDSSSLADNNINCLFIDSRGFLWVGTRGGLSRYNAATNNFKNFYHSDKDKNSLSSSDIWSVAEDGFKNIWAGTLDAGLNKIIISADDKIKTLQYKNDSTNSKSISDNSVWSLYFDKKGYGWAGTSKGLNIFRPSKNNDLDFIHYSNNTDISSLADDFVWRIYADENENLWFSSINGSLDYIPENADRQRLSFTHTATLLSKIIGAPIHSVYDFIKDKNGRSWVTVNTSFLIACNIFIDNNTHTASLNDVLVFKNEKSKSAGLLDNFLWKLYCDKQGLVWAGSQKGISVYDPYKEQFDFLKTSSKEIAAGEKNISSVYGDDENNIWLAGGDSLYLIVNGSIKKIDFSQTQINSVFYSSGAGLFAGTFSGLYYAAPQEVQSFISGQKSSTDFTEAQNIFNDFPAFKSVNFIANNKDELLIAGNQKFILFNTHTKKTEYFQWISQYLKTDAANTFRAACVQGNFIWLGTDDGLFVFDRANKKLVKIYNTISLLPLVSNRINDLYNDEKGNIYIATPNGLNIYNEASDKISLLSERDGIADNNIRSIAADKKGNIWLATRNGLCSFNPSKKETQSYTTANGLTLNQLNCVQVSPNGNMLFIGSDNGFNSLSLTKDFAKPPAPQIVFTDFLIHGKTILDEDKNLTEKFRRQQDMKLNYQQNYFTISFSALSFSNPSSNKYAYKLEGFDTGWVASNNISTATYTNLKAGTYTFYVRAANSYGVWNNEGIKLVIIITPPWWQTNLFYICSLLAIVAILYGIYKIRLNRILADQKMRNKIASDLHDDIGSSLSGISIYSEIAKTKTQYDHPELYRMLSAISENTKTTQQNMQDIVWSINPYNDSFEKIITRMKVFAAEILEPKDIELKFSAEESLNSLELSSDRRKNFFLIFKEAVNNCAKYAACKKVDVELKKEGSKIYLSVKDDGKGFDMDTVRKGNGLATMQARAKELKGEYSITSSPGNGVFIQLVFATT